MKNKNQKVTVNQIYEGATFCDGEGLMIIQRCNMSEIYALGDDFDLLAKTTSEMVKKLNDNKFYFIGASLVKI